MRKLCFLVYLLSISFGCQHKHQKIKVEAAEIHQWNMVLEEAIINDYFSPPVASRIYSYPNLAAYIILHPSDSIGLIKSISSLPKIAQQEGVNRSISAGFAFYYTTKELVYSVDTLDNYFLKFYPEHEAERTFGKEVARQILQWASKDGYKTSRSADEFTFTDSIHTWRPTPPDYLAALEPEWGLSLIHISEPTRPY